MPTAFEELSRCLEQAETWSARLPQANAEQILQVITGLDCAQHWIEHLIASDARRPAEEIQRAETIKTFLRKDIPLVANRLKGVSLRAVAAERAHDPDAWWWHLPELAQQQRRQKLRRMLMTGAVAVVVVVVGIILMRTVFAPDPLVVASSNAMEAAQRAILEDQDLELALGALNLGLENVEKIVAERGKSLTDYNITDLLTWRGVILQELGHVEEAEADFAAAKAQNPWEMYAHRLTAYRYLGKPEMALPDAQSLVELDPEHPAAYLLLGDVYNELDNLSAANEAYKKAEELSFDSEKFSNIYVLARQRRANLQGVPIQ